MEVYLLLGTVLFISLLVTQFFYMNKLMMNKIVCVYAYYEKNEEYKENLIFFLENGINDSCDYIFVINGECTVNIPDKHLIFHRENTGYDYAGYTYASEHTDLMKYDYLFFMNTSIRGPYSDTKDWQSIFINLLSEDVKLVGTVVNTNISIGVHISCQIFLVDNESYKFLKDSDFFSSSTNVTNYHDAIHKKEIVLSTLIGASSIGSRSLFGESEIAPVVLGVMSIFVSLLNTLGTYFSWTRRAESHRISFA